MMRAKLALLAGAVLLASATVPAVAGKRKAPPKIQGDYDVAFKAVGSSCTDVGLALQKGTFTISQTGGKVKVSFPMTPIMRGNVDGEGKLQARAKRGATAIRGVEGEFSVSGTADGAQLDVLFVAAYFTSGKPYCQQSWSATGPRR